MTTWSIQYGDETGHSIMRETDDIADVHATLEHVVKDEERTAGYAGQTATWHGYVSRDEDGYAPGNWTLDIVNLDTHTADGYVLGRPAHIPADEWDAMTIAEQTAMAEWEDKMGREMVPHEGPQCAACGDETCTADAAHHTVTEFAETTHAVTLVTEFDDYVNVASFGTDAKGADAHQRTLVKMITLSREPLPAVAEHGPNWATWTVSGEHDTFGSWRVILSASEDGAEQCGTCGEWFADSDAWNAHNDLAHY